MSTNILLVATSGIGMVYITPVLSALFAFSVLHLVCSVIWGE